MKRKFLEELGLEKDLIDKIIDQNSQDIGSYKKQVDDLTETNKQLSKDIETRDTQLDDLKKAGSVDDLKTQIAELQQANTTAKSEYEQKIADMKYDAAIEKALSTAKHYDLVSGKVDRTKLKINEDGSIFGLDEQVKELKTKYTDLFKPDKRGKGFNDGAPAEKKPEEMTYEDFIKQAESAE